MVQRNSTAEVALKGWKMQGTGRGTTGNAENGGCCGAKARILRPVNKNILPLLTRTFFHFSTLATRMSSWVVATRRDTAQSTQVSLRFREVRSFAISRTGIRAAQNLVQMSARIGDAPLEN